MRQFLRPGAASDAFVAAFDGTQEKARTLGGRLAPPERIEVRIHYACTEELAAYARGSVAFKEFPGGMRRSAQEVAPPGLRWCAVELLERGKSAGTRLTAFVQVGQRWVLLAKPWAALPGGG